MGITSLWKLIHSSERTLTLEQLAHEVHLKQGCGLRVAIDIALWVFQSKSSVVGDQSETRMLFFRFARLYELGIRPVFVFDGPKRPEYKRNKFINTVPLESQCRSNLIAMIKFFGFSLWNSYGEAEAECALLQRLGFVDAVYTGDSDVFLFGARRVIRQWPSKRYEPVPVYDLTWIYDSTGLDRSDLILIALLHGSDYDTKGTKGIGINVAAQLAKCHFHRELFDDIQLAGREPLDDERVQHLFDDLTYELQHNSTKNMKKKHAGVVLDPKFPDFSIVTDFIHPWTNIQRNDAGILKLARELRVNLDSNKEPDWQSLANFAQHTFKWPGEYVLKRFTSLLFPAYMANLMRRKATHPTTTFQRTASSSLHMSPLLSSHRSAKNSGSSQQTLLSDFYRTTTRSQPPEKPDIIVQLSATKIIPEGDIKLYRVEWHRACWEHFISLLKPRLDFELYKDIAILSQHIQSDFAGNTEIDEDASSKKGAGNKDLFDLVKRQWIDARDVHRTHSSLALEFQGKRKRKPTAMSSDGLTNPCSFLILPPKRIRNNSAN